MLREEAMTNLQKLQDVLRKKGIDRITGHYSIKARVHPNYGNLHQFKYSQLDSPMESPVVQACRGIVLDSNDNWKVACHTFEKFFNSVEKSAAKVSWDNANIYEKLDGSLIQLFYYDGKWNMTTSGSPDGAGPVGDNPFTFKELFWETWNYLSYDFPKDKSLSYAFELCTEHNRIVVSHDSPRIVLLGARSNVTNEELDVYDVGGNHNWEIVNRYDIGDINVLNDLLKDMDPYSQEGFVVCDSNFNRIKIKSQKYVAIHHVITSMSERKILDIVRNGETEEVLSHFPKFKNAFDVIIKRYDNLISEAKDVWQVNMHIEGQKEFATAISDFPLKHALFQYRAGKIHEIKEYVKEMNIRNLEKIIGISDDFEK